MLRICKTCKATDVPWDDLTRGVRVGKNGKDWQFVTISDEELEALPTPGSKGIAVDGFCDQTAIDPITLCDPVWLTPDDGGELAFSLLREQLTALNLVAVGRAVMRGDRSWLVSVWPKGEAMLLWKMAYQADLVTAGDLPDLPTRIDEAKLAEDAPLARQLIRSMPLPHPIADYKDEIDEALRTLVAQKAAGVVPKADAAAAQAAVRSLKEQMRLSMEALKTAPPAPAVAVPEKKAKATTRKR